ncbi:unnamed protein product [Clonostachys rosea f. rosea IK726]|uniref:Uncharacterized protein n=1 Tax=Clonostachys rosea f. rosea IK726 TaxID=1349383 RepID=A0ACA9UAE4_BIOOC|nr:unnamed protein product [Clonostachys rosea f. rosea IK726]
MTKGEEETNSHVPADFDQRYLRGPTGPCQVEVRMYLLHVDVLSVTDGVRAIRNLLGQQHFLDFCPQWNNPVLALPSSICNASWKQDAILPSVGKFLGSAAFRLSFFLLSLRH